MTLAHHDWPEHFDDHPHRTTADIAFVAIVLVIILGGLAVALLQAKGIII